MNAKNLVDKKLWLAPLAGVTDKAYRSICKECGAEVMVSEMVSADGLVHKQDKSLVYAEFEENHRPFGIQLFGSNPEIMAQGAEIISKLKPDFIDINMGCPVKKVVKRGAGSALMKTPEIAAEIVQQIKFRITDIPLSVKFRSGWDQSSLNAVHFGKLMEEAGADILCIHPRTRSQMFSGKSDWSIIKELKQNVSIPVIGNGDIFSGSDTVKMYNKTNCDSVMIGRSIIGKPWLFYEIKEGKKFPDKKKIELIKKHYNLTLQNRGKHIGLLEMRTHIQNYTKGLRGARECRKAINETLEKKIVLREIENLYQRNYG